MQPISQYNRRSPLASFGVVAFSSGLLKLSLIMCKIKVRYEEKHE